MGTLREFRPPRLEVGLKRVRDEERPEQSDQGERHATDRELRHQTLPFEGFGFGEHDLYCGLQWGIAAEATRRVTKAEYLAMDEASERRLDLIDGRVIDPQTMASPI